jgi:REP element-mobilizing transposase RayT
MPNHLHCILYISKEQCKDAVGAPLVHAHAKRAGIRTAPSLGTIIGAFKSITTIEYIEGVREKNWPMFDGRLWQRNYFDHIIRDNNELNKIRKYIMFNPKNWCDDNENPMNWE